MHNCAGNATTIPGTHLSHDLTTRTAIRRVWPLTATTYISTDDQRSRPERGKKTRRGDVNSMGETQKMEGGKGSVVYFTCSAFAFWTWLSFCIIERISAVIWKKKNPLLLSLAEPSIPHSTSHKRHSDGVCRISFSVAMFPKNNREHGGGLFAAFCILARSYEYIGFSLNKNPT
jgi:hypothetical protein